LQKLFDQIRDTLQNRTDRFVIVSMAAGVSIETLESYAKGAYPIIRMMPNTPVAVGEGMTVYATNAQATEEDVTGFLAGLTEAGRFDRVSETLIDAAGALSGCGPAFVYLFAEALADGGVSCGLPRDKANEYAAQTLLGAAKMLLETGKHPGELKDAVCSPGGSTIAGVRALEQRAFRASCMEAVEAAWKRTKELGK
jgi:pyrroline-5-carboxylate reductase